MDANIPNEVTIRRGIDSKELDAVIELFDEAFSGKFSYAVKDPVLRKKLWAKVINNDQITVAERDHEILGMALFSFKGSPSFRNVKTSEIIKMLGVLKSLRAAFVFGLFSALDWKPTPRVAYLEAISVSSSARGLGVGSRLLEDARQLSRERGCQSLVLSVVLENEAAKRLYLRDGFTVTDVKKPKLLGLFTNVAGATVMSCQL